MASAFHTGLSNDLGFLLDNEIEYNVTIQVGKDDGFKEFRAHSIILRSRSSYFQKMFSSDSSDSSDKIEKQNDDVISIKFKDIDVNVFQAVLT